MVGFELVLPEGNVVQVSQDSYPDLFWGLKVRAFLAQTTLALAPGGVVAVLSILTSSAPPVLPSDRSATYIQGGFNNFVSCPYSAATMWSNFGLACCCRVLSQSSSSRRTSRRRFGYAILSLKLEAIGRRLTLLKHSFA